MTLLNSKTNPTNFESSKKIGLYSPDQSEKTCKINLIWEYGKILLSEYEQYALLHV